MEQQYLAAWFDAAFPGLAAIQRPVREYLLKYANVDDFRLEMSIRDCSGDHQTFYSTKHYKEKYGEFCANTEEMIMTGSTPFREIFDMRKLDKLLQKMDLDIHNTELIEQFTAFVITKALFAGFGHKLLYDKQYREFVAVTCDWE